MRHDLSILLHPGLFALLESRERKQSDMLLLAAAFAARSGAIIIDGGNHFNAYMVIQTVRLNTIDLASLDKLQIARAFNCHQVVALAQQIPLDGRPCLLIDILDLFQDDNVLFDHRVYLVKKLLNRLTIIHRQAPLFVSLVAPKEADSQWYFMANLIRKESTQTLEEGFMGKTLPTINQIIQRAEVILARFSRIQQVQERSAIDSLFISAKKHIAAISEANHLIPFEAAQQAMLLEQQKEIIGLSEKLRELEDRLENA
ncbi:MAG: hypothetical protein GWN62_29600 [Aliifodinibius sp.]|nr:hypothetical protein [Fodinibius sp.]